MTERNWDMRFNEQERRAAIERAEHWTADQAARLQTTPAVILEAVRRGWLPGDIEAARSKYALEGNPPPLEGVEPWMDRKPKIRRAA